MNNEQKIYTTGEIEELLKACSDKMNQPNVRCWVNIVNQLLYRQSSMQKALKFYADKEIYDGTYKVLSCECCSEYESPAINADEGEIARVALGTGE